MSKNVKKKDKENCRIGEEIPGSRMEEKKKKRGMKSSNKSKGGEISRNIEEK